MSSPCWHFLDIGCFEELAGTKTMEKPWKMEGFGNLPGSMLAIYRAELAPLGGYVGHLGGYDGPFWDLAAPCLVLVGIS